VSQSFRHPEILEIARREGRVTVEDLAERFGVTLQTIRRDLGDLAESGRLERVHGGAVLPSGTVNIGYAHRQDLHAGAKAAIARACAAEIPHDCALFLNIGTSTEAVAAELHRHRDLLVVTNNLNVARILAEASGVSVVVTGGILRRPGGGPADGGLVGELTRAAVAQFKFDLAVIGCSALDEDGDLLDFDLQEVGVSRTILRQARRTYVVADGSKLQRTAPARIASLAEVDALFTDRPVPGALARACAEWGTRIVVAGPGAGR
jgi:DeoR family glycerol-3-phosphate regulon repressor